MIIDRLYEKVNNYPPDHKEYILANYFLQQRKEMKNLSLNDIVNDTQLSKSTIIRFIQTIGAENFTQFRLSYMENLHEKSLIRHYSKKSQDERDDFTKIAVDFIGHNWKTVINDFVYEVIHLISDRKKIIIFGTSQDLAHISYIPSKFFELGIEVKLLKEETIGQFPDKYYPISKDNTYFFITLNESISKFIDTTAYNAIYNKTYYIYINKILSNEEIPKIFMTARSKEVYKGAYYFLGDTKYESLKVITLILVIEAIYVELQKRSS